MKKNLLCFATLLCSLYNADAQALFTAPHSVQAVPQSITRAPENAIKWGYSLVDEIDGFLGTQSTGNFGVAMFVPGSGMLNGSSIVSVNLPVNYTGMKNVVIWGRKNINMTTNDFEIAVTQPLTAGYNEIELATPYAISGDFYLGYSFTINDASTKEAQYPIGINSGYAPKSFLLNQGNGFLDYSDQGYGVSALQIYVTGLEIKDYDAQFEPYNSIFSKPNEEWVLPLSIVSNSGKTATEIEYEFSLNGVKETRTLTATIPSGFNMQTYVDVPVKTPAELGVYTIDVTITKLNGQPNGNNKHMIIYGENLARKAAYKTLVEELTGTGCPWCPRGYVGMEKLKEEASDVCVPIAVHWYNTSDPMYPTDYGNLPLGSAPSVAYNRMFAADPYYGTTKDTPFGILDEVRALDEYTLSPIEVKVSGRYNEDKTAVDATAEVEFITSLGSYTVEFVLTADSLRGTSSAWRQANNYYVSTALMQGIDKHKEPELARFCKGGTYGSSYVFLTFNDVAIASSCSKGINLAPELPLDFQRGDVVTCEHTLNMPTKAVLKNAIRPELVFINAMVFDENGYCVNATRSRVLAIGEEDGIQTITTDATTTPAYRLDGLRAAADARGLIIRDGKVCLIR